MDFFSILKNYIEHNRLYFYQSKLIHFIKDNNIDKYIKFKIQNGGFNYLTVIDNIELKFDYFIIFALCFAI